MRVVNKRKHAATGNDVYIGRPSPLGNPYSHMPDTLASFKCRTREESIEKYELWLRDKLKCGDEKIKAEFARLRQDTVLVCWCVPSRCHGDVIAKLWQERNQMSYYESETGEAWKTTVDSENRRRDKARIESQSGLSEQGNSDTEFRSGRILLAKGYLRIVYGDHGPYIEFLPKHMIRENWKRSVTKGPQAWYDECQPVDGSSCKLYVQKRDVKRLANPPRGKYSCNNNRAEGYADYRVGRLYVSPDEVLVTPSHVPALEGSMDLDEGVITGGEQLGLFDSKEEVVQTPSDDSTPSIICTAGHRPDKLGGYSDRVLQKTLKVAHMTIEQLTPVSVVSGMALGWDQMLALAALECDIPFTAAVPLRGFECKWPEKSQEMYHMLLQEAEKVVYVDEEEHLKYQRMNKFIRAGMYSATKMQTRNAWMVDHSTRVAALWDGSSGGTFNCIQYARSVSVPVVNFWEIWTQLG